MAYLYRHIRLDKNEPFYIGIGSDDIYQRANSKTHRNNHWKSITSITDYRVEILFDDITYEFAKEKEIEFIQIHKRKEDGGTLCNITLGGDGCLGLVHTEEARKKMGNPNKGKTISDWHKQKISEFHTGKVVSEETRKKMSNKLLGDKNPMYGKKRSDYAKLMTGIKTSGELNGFSKLKEKDVLEIRKLAKEGFSQRKLAKMYNVAKSTIADILKRKSWKHI
jgi:DNA-binding transcriptional regulator YiaG